QSSASSLSSGEYLPGSLQGKISSDGCLKKEQMVVSAIASTPHSSIHGVPPSSAKPHPASSEILHKTLYIQYDE
ncbi:hypothetical protein MMR65_24835, partial [Escherichia coli]|nr:hypothetical protein [Escherichia coli]MCM4503861.1 hypothetical protein [Escherichia coli]